jgi:aspartate aminotransferase-like enzyme
MIFQSQLRIPGPTPLPERVVRAASRPMIDHRGPEFAELLADVTEGARRAFETRNDLLVLTASGSGGLESAVANLVSPGDKVVVALCGNFGERFAGIAAGYGCELTRLEAEWGQPVEPDDLARVLEAQPDARVVLLTHNETSTGVTNDLAALARVVHEESPDTLILVDAVSSLAGIPVHFDAWALDVCFASVQKGIALPPGITVFALSERALARTAKTPYRGTYFDFLQYKKHADTDGVPSTPSIPHFYALAAQLDAILRRETLEVRFQRHEAMRELTIRKTATYAKLASDPAHASATVSALAPVKDPEVIRSEMKKRGYTLGGGYGDWKTMTFRIGHMGDIPLASLEAMLDVLTEVAQA